MGPHSPAALRMSIRRNPNQRSQEHRSGAKRQQRRRRQMNYNFSVQHLQKSCDSPRVSATAHTRWSAGMDPYPPDRFRPPGERVTPRGTMEELGHGDRNPLLFKLRRANAFPERGRKKKKKKQLAKGRQGRAGAAGARGAARALCVVRCGEKEVVGEGLPPFSFPKKDDCYEVPPPPAPSSAAPHRRTPPPGCAPFLLLRCGRRWRPPPRARAAQPVRR